MERKERLRRNLMAGKTFSTYVARKTRVGVKQLWKCVECFDREVSKKKKKF